MRLGRPNESEKTTAVVGEKWWPREAEQEGWRNKRRPPTFRYDCVTLELTKYFQKSIAGVENASRHGSTHTKSRENLAAFEGSSNRRQFHGRFPHSSKRRQTHVHQSGRFRKIALGLSFEVPFRMITWTSRIIV